MQFIGKLMRKVDAAAIEAQLADIDGQSAAARHFFHTLEQWRDKLIAEPNTLTDFISQHPNVERQALRQLVLAAANSRPPAYEEPSDAHKRAQRALFKFIRSTLTEDSEQPSLDLPNDH
jgi:ribosome-associated protein